jgi:DNA repair exonuclease SbcCD ATPase subunit
MSDEDVDKLVNSLLDDEDSDNSNEDSSDDDNDLKDDDNNLRKNNNSENNLDNEEEKELSKTAKYKKEKYNARRVREFLIRVASAVKRYEIRMNAHKDFHTHVDKLQENINQNIKKTSGYDPAEEIKQLKNKVNQLLKIQADPDIIEKNIQYENKIKELEAKIDRLISSKSEKDRRFHELEKKIEIKYKKEKDYSHELERRILELEKRLVEHQIARRKANKEIDHETVSLIRDKINSTKEKLDNLRAISNSNKEHAY